MLTAAHCHEEGFPGYEVLEVVLGEHDVAFDPDCDSCSPRQKFTPAKIIQHEKWSNLNKGR